MSNTKQVQSVREKMLSIFGEGCWMMYKLDRKNPYTYHHIREARKGGKVTVDNGALLTRLAHDDLNALECCAPYLYRELNVMFKELNKTKKPPTKEYFKEVNGILLRADDIIELSEYCELNPDFVLLEEFARITQEKYPDIPEVTDLIDRMYSHEARCSMEKQKSKRKKKHSKYRKRYY